MSPDGVYGKEEWGSDPAAAMAEALRRIDHVCETGETWLYLSDLFALEALPPELERCSHIERLDVGEAEGPDSLYYSPFFQSYLTGWAHLAALENLTWLNLSHTNVGELSPLSGLAKLESFNCMNSLVNDLTPLLSLPNFTIAENAMSLSFEKTPLTNDKDWAKIAELEDKTLCTRWAVSLLHEFRGDEFDPFDIDQPVNSESQALDSVEPKDYLNEASSQQAHAAVGGGLEAVVRGSQVDLSQYPVEVPKPVDLDPTLRERLDRQAQRVLLTQQDIQREHALLRQQNDQPNLTLGRLEGRVAAYHQALIADDPVVSIVDLHMTDMLAPAIADDYQRGQLDAGLLAALDNLVAHHAETVAVIDKGAVTDAPKIGIAETAVDQQLVVQVAVSLNGIATSSEGVAVIGPNAQAMTEAAKDSAIAATTETPSISAEQTTMRAAWLRRTVKLLGSVIGGLLTGLKAAKNKTTDIVKVVTNLEKLWATISKMLDFFS
ncbi:MAG: hypothetical protein ACPGGK_12060 [Pikeienuella sp.]